MDEEKKPLYVFKPYRLNEAYKVSFNEVSQKEFARFFKKLSKFIRKNPDLELEDMQMSILKPNTGSSDGDTLYLFEFRWVDYRGVLDE